MRHKGQRGRGHALVEAQFVDDAKGVKMGKRLVYRCPRKPRGLDQRGQRRDRLALLRGREQIVADVGHAVNDSGVQAAPNTVSRSDAATNRFINPVCGVAVRTVSALHVEEHDGVSFYCCCDGCWTTFRKDPAKYAAIHHSTISLETTS